MESRIEEITSSPTRIGVIGLGYVGLPLAVEFARHFEVVGFDIDRDRVSELSRGEDSTREVELDDLKLPRLSFSADPESLRRCTFLIIAVPTPIDRELRPDLSGVISASKTAGSVLGRGMTVVYESTVYPGVTEEICLPILEQESGLNREEFNLGYSPERINPGDREHSLRRVVKVVSGDRPETAADLSRLYGTIVEAGIHCAPNIRTAEAAKVIENIQRDLNIALINELSYIFARLNIDTREVLDAANTKWNFHRYEPGLVGGHCIGVDPYYLTYRAQQVGIHPEVILAGRNVNEQVGIRVAEAFLNGLQQNGRRPAGSRALVMGMTFKENVPDLRNSQAGKVIRHLRGHRIEVLGWDPLLDPRQIESAFGLVNCPLDQAGPLDGVLILAGHNEFRDLSLEELKRVLRTPILIDPKGLFQRTEALEQGFFYFTL